MTPTPEHVVTTHAELQELWQNLMGPWGFDMTSLWTIFLAEDGRVSPVLMPIDELPEQPTTPIEALGELISRSLDEQGLATTAFLLARPGSPRVSTGDRAWARALLSLGDTRLTHWPIHLATEGSVRVLAPDDLLRTA